MFYLIGYIVIWVLVSVLFNRLIAHEDGERFASEMILVEVMAAFIWPVILPFILMCIIVKLIVNHFKKVTK